jgi:hypothetical protein
MPIKHWTHNPPQGSHKSNYPVPSSLLCHGDEWTQHVTEIHAKAGDCMVFMEACVHGVLPRKAAYERRALLYRYTPGHAACAKTTYFCLLCA